MCLFSTRVAVGGKLAETADNGLQSSKEKLKQQCAISNLKRIDQLSLYLTILPTLLSCHLRVVKIQFFCHCKLFLTSH